MKRTAGLLLSLALIVPAIGQTSATVQSRIMAPIDDSVRVTIPHSTHPLAQPAFDVGPLDGATKLERMILVLRGNPDQEYHARTLLDSQQTKGSPQYHQWLTPEEYGQKFGPSQQDVAQVTGWLQQRGFIVGSVARSGLWLEFSGTSAQVEAAFQTQMRQYLVQGELHVANATDISMPAALSPVVKGVATLHNFFKKPMISHVGGVHRDEQGQLVNVAGPNFTASNGGHFLTPGDFATIYDLNPLLGTFNGAGQTIAIVARSNIITNDIPVFRLTFGSTVSPTQVILNGPDPGDVPGDDIEATLDTEWSGGVATGAAIDVVVSASTLTTDGVDLSAMFIVDNNLAPIMSVSFGQCERLLGATENSFFNDLWQQAAAQGISVFVSAGDDGAAGCDDPNDPSNTPASGGLAVSGLASTPFNTAVGGTEFNETVNGNTAANFWNTANTTSFESAKGYIPEMVWNESCDPATPMSPCAQTGFSLFAGSGGASTIYGKPSWQSLSIPGMPNDGQRDIPDVSLTAAGGHDGYLICFSGDPITTCNSIGGFLLNAGVIGGTSASSPSFAGIMAIIDQKLGGRQGLANYVLYSLAKNENFASCNSSSRTNPAVGTSCIFNDTTVGNNNVPGQTGFNAAAGYDLASGLGSVDGNNLATAWANSVFTGSTTTLTVTSPALTGGMLNITHGQQVNATISVASMATGTPTGNVALVTNAPGTGANGTIGVGAGPLTSGSFSNLPGGTYTLSAHYPGDGVFGASDSSGITANVARENSVVSLNATVINTNHGAPAPLSAVPYGDPNNIIVFDAFVAGASGNGFPTGNVTFSDGSTVITSIVPLNSRADGEVANCFFPFTCLTVGTHSITASYPTADNSFNAGGPSNAVSVTVVKGSPTAVVNAPTTAGVGVAFTLQALIGTRLGTIIPTGTVQFFDGASALGGSVVLSGGGANMQVTFNGVGTTHSITAQYSGDNTYNPATSAAATVNVVAPFNFTAASTSQTIAAGGTATYNVTLNSVDGFTGQVSFNCTGAPGGSTCTVNPNSATLNSFTFFVPLTVTVTNTASAKLNPNPWKIIPLAFAGVLALAFAGFGRKPRQRLLLLLAVFLVAAITSCGGGGSPGSTIPPPTNATLVVTGTSGQITNSITLSLTVTH